jgi:pimeloyl-ACP methyl ester carboxylesterase
VADSSEGAAVRLSLAEQVLREGMGVATDMMLPRVFAPATFDKSPRVVDAVRKTMLVAPPEGVAAASRGMAQRPDVRADLPRIAVPTLVLVGQSDAISPPDEMRAIADAIPGSEFVVITDAGHMTPVENPAAFNTALERFLVRVE